MDQNPLQQVIEVLPPEARPQPVKSATPKDFTQLKLSKRIIAAIDHYADHGGAIADTARAKGASPEYLSRVLRRSDVVEYVKARCEQRLTFLRSKAVDRIDTLMTGARSEYVQLEAAKAVLAETKTVERAGAGDISITITL